jgi:calcium-dependent protein kinase
MLTYDPSTRPSAKEVLQHPWVQQTSADDAVDKPLAESFMLNLAKFKVLSTQTKQKFQYAVLSFMASQLMTYKEVEQLSKFFSKCDLNQDGRLSIDEVKRGFIESKMIADLSAIMAECDANLNGFIDYTEFLTATINWKQSISLQRLEAAFQAFDINGDGRIASDELQKMFGGERTADDAVVQSLLAEVDSNCDGVVDLEEFKALMLRHAVRAAPAAIKIF